MDIQNPLPSYNFFANWILSETYRIPFQEIKEKILHQSRFAADYFLLMICSVIICTLGLLLDAPAVIIGGMIISPLMWPLLHIALGIATADHVMLFRGVRILLVSLVVSLLTAVIITYISPVKLVTREILARSNPTIIDLIIALTAGIIATIAVFHRRISESLAGVAIATSLMPPLSVGGIGLVLGNFTVSGGSLLLFTTNIFAIIFVAAIIFTLLGFEEKDFALRRKGFYFLGVILIIISVPLVMLYYNYAFRLKAFDKTKKTMNTYFSALSKEIEVENLNLSYSSGFLPSDITVYADILIPNTISLDYYQRERLATILENELGKKVDIHLRIFPTASFVSFEKRENGKIENILSESFRTELQELNPYVEMSSFEIDNSDTTNEITINTTVYVDIDNPITETEKNIVETDLSKVVEKKVVINMVMLPRLHLVSGEAQKREEIKSTVQNYLLYYYPTVTINNITVTKKENTSSFTISIEMYADAGAQIKAEDITKIKEQLAKNYKGDFTLDIQIIERKKLSL